MKAKLYALAAICLWAALAALGVALKHVPPFLLTGIALAVGSVLAWPALLQNRRQLMIAPRTLGLGVGTLFGYHFLLFIGLRIASAVPSFDGLLVSNCQFNSNASSGFSYNPSGTLTNNCLNILALGGTTSGSAGYMSRK